MSSTAISVEGLSKLYRIGLAEQRHESLVSATLEMAKAPLRNFRNLWRLDTSRSGAEEEDDLLWALRDVSFEVQRGEVLGVIGRNGAGKSTLLKILSRVTAPTSGRVVINGRISSLLEVGTGFHPELTGRDNVYLNGTILGMTRREIDRKFDEIVEFSGVEKFLDTPIKRYSSGMKVRLAFAVAAHLEPEVLIVDEVLAVGDYEFQAKCIGKMQEMSSARNGRTVLFVSHNMGAVRNLCSRGILLEGGRMKHDGPVQEVVDMYMSTGPNQKPVEVTFPVEGGLPSQYVSASIVDPQGRGSYEQSCDDPVTVCLEYEVREEVPGVQLAMLVLNSEGTRVLFSDVRDTIPAIGSLLTKGRHQFRIAIPDRLLAPGEYVINIGSRSHDGTIDHHAGCLKFLLRDLTTRRESRAGVLSVILPWHHELEGQIPTPMSEGATA